jgi:hypothetical protein
MWTAKHSLETTAAPEAVWRRLCEVRTWPEWDLALASAVLKDAPGRGASGTLLTRTGARRAFVLGDVVPGLTFTLVVRLTLAELRSVHTLEATQLGCRITHRLELGGAFGWLHSWFKGRRLREAQAPTLRNLARIAHLD